MCSSKDNKNNVDKKYFRDEMQNIANKVHKNSSKRRIVEYEDRIQLACPVCLDSDKNNNKKRGNLYFENLFYVCFNCGHKSSFTKLCKDFGLVINPSTKLQIYEYLDNHISYDNYQDTFMESTFDDLISLEQLVGYFNNVYINGSPISDVKPIVKYGKVYKYLLDRGISDNLHTNIYQGKFQKGPEWFEDVIILLNRKNDKVLGIQIRNLKSGNNRMFKIYNYEQLFNWLNPEVELEDISKIVMYNKLSYFFNILNINFDSCITIFEGYLDSLFYPNSIGVVGTNTDTTFLEDNNLDIQFFYDNDKAGFIKSSEKIVKGFRVFLWKKLFNYIVENKKTKDPYSLYNRVSKVKDLNSLAMIVKNPYIYYKLNNHFSIDRYDIKYIPKFSKKYVKY